MHDNQAIRDAVVPLLDTLGLRLYDVEFTGTGRARVVRITVEAEGGIGIDQITDATRALDPVVDPLVTGAFQLEVSSPGLERNLRRPEHFAGALGQKISVKFRDATGAVERVHVQLLHATDAGIDVLTDQGATAAIAFDAITAAHTVFEWGPTPKPGASKPAGSKPAGSKQGAAKPGGMKTTTASKSIGTAKPSTSRTKEITKS